ncbi:MAG: type II secretion system protein [Candidatus Saccharimonadales bacterium]
MKRTHGFTVIEIIIVILFLGIATTILLVQRANLSATGRDNQRKTAINAMYYNLEEVFYAKNGYYPSKIDSKNLTAMDPSLFTDPNGVSLGDQNANYRYEASNCTNNECKDYTLRAQLEKEADYIKTNRQH